MVGHRRRPQQRRDEEVFALEAELNSAVLDATEGFDNVLIISQGTMAVRSLTQSLAVALEADGRGALEAHFTEVRIVRAFPWLIAEARGPR